MAQVIDFFRQVRSEISKIIWPTRRETLMTAVSVCFMISVVAILFLGVDWGLSSVISFILRLGKY